MVFLILGNTSSALKLARFAGESAGGCTGVKSISILVQG